MKIQPIISHRYFHIFITLVAIVGVGASGFFYLQYQKAQKIVINSNLVEEQEIKDLVKKVSRLMLLPTDEEPTVATVSDFNKLKDQPFFKNAQNGDKLLIYTNAKTAILYDPKKDLILAVAPLNIGTDAQETLTMEVRNGTQTSGLAQSVSENLNKNNIYNVQKVGDAKKNNYSKTLVIDLGKSSNKNTIDVLAKELNAELIKVLPDGELNTTSDLIIIIGSDYKTK